MRLLPMLLALSAPGSVGSGASLLSNALNQPEALTSLAQDGATAGEADVLLALKNGWFEAAKRSLSMMRSQGEPVASLTEVRAAATSIRDQAAEVINLMRTGANAEETVVTTAFLWAQRPDFLFLNVKFSSRIDGPVTCLNVDNERIEFGNNTLFFEGVGRQKPKVFRLNLTFHGAILPEASSWSFASVGRISFTIAKAENMSWPRLLEGKAKPKNMHAWYDRQQVLDAEVKKEKEAAKAAREAAAKDAAKEPASPPSSPPAVSPPGSSETGAPGSGPPSNAPPAPPKGKGGKRKAKPKGGKQQKKDEL